MSAAPILVLDTGALLAYAAGHGTVGERLALISDINLRAAIPTTCLAEAHRVLPNKQSELLNVLADHVQVDVNVLTRDDCLFVGHLSRERRLGFGHAVHLARATNAMLITDSVDHAQVLLTKRWPIAHPDAIINYDDPFGF
ncbi:hypothetical protein R8Z50_22090 [Longispora sp. K20-0274]|uniref:hypothetical protein n=1 Tax=Longispora sp. K20-0274 TaxID=3088255 RepID=UPI00399B807C